MENEKIIGRIRKLLNMTVENGCSIDEALNATSKVQELLQKYNLSMASVENSQDKKDEQVETIQMEATRVWMRNLGTIIANNMGCQMYYITRDRKTVLNFIGLETAVKTATATYEAILVAIEKGYKSYKKTTGQGADKVSYCLGYVRAIQASMAEKCRELAIIVPQPVLDEIEKLNTRNVFRKVKQKTYYTDRASYSAGYTDGRSAHGTKQIC